MPPPGSKPYSSAGQLEERMNKRQELISIRQDNRFLKRELSKLRKQIQKTEKFPDVEFYQRELPGLRDLKDNLEAELEDLKNRESELLGKTVEQKKAETDFIHTATNPKTGERIGWNGKKWIRIK